MEAGSAIEQLFGAAAIFIVISFLRQGVNLAAAYVAAHILGTTLFQNSRLTIGTVYLIFYYLDTMRGPFWDMIRQVEELQKTAASINRITALRQIQPTLRDGPGIAWPSGPLSVAFEQVTFH